MATSNVRSAVAVVTLPTRLERLWSSQVSPRHEHKFHRGVSFVFHERETSGTPVVCVARTRQQQHAF